MTSLLLAMALVGDAGAATHELSFNWSSLHAPDDNWDYYSDRESLNTWGLRAGFGLTDRLSVVAGWQHDVQGGTLYFDYGDDEWDAASVSLALTSNTWTVGPKYGVEVFPWLYPYATVQGALLWGTTKLDDDVEDDENMNELRASGLAPGALGALGLEFRALRVDRPVRPAVFAEFGYGWMAPLQQGDLGELTFRGFYANWGLGARF